MAKVLDVPSRKIFIKDLEYCRRSNNDESESDWKKRNKDWLVEMLGRTVTLRVVWLQGFIIECSEDGDIVVIDDDTGTVKVIGCNKIPYSSTKLKKNQYAMVIGQVVSAGSRPLVKPIKIQCITHSVSIQTLWTLEVLDQTLFCVS